MSGTLAQAAGGLPFREAIAFLRQKTNVTTQHWTDVWRTGHSPDAADADQPTFGFTGQFGERVAGEIPAPMKGLRGGTVVRVGESVIEVISANASGYFFQNAVA